MNDDEWSLKDLLVHDLPVLFGGSLLDQMTVVYPEAHASVYENPSLGDAEADYLLGHQRRALAETVFKNTAVKHGLRVKYIEPPKGGCKSVYATSSRFGFTMCHVQTPCQFPRHSDTRAQSALINKYIPQLSLFDVEDDKKKLYGIFIHAELLHTKKELGSIHIGFPNSDFSGWADIPTNLLDVIDEQKQRFQKQTDLQSQIQNPEPKLKDQKKRKHTPEDHK